MPSGTGSTDNTQENKNEEQGTFAKLKASVKGIASVIKLLNAPETSLANLPSDTTLTSVSSPPQETHSLGVVALGKIGMVFCSNISDILEEAQPLKDFLTKMSKKANKLSSEFNLELAYLYPPKDEKSSQVQPKIKKFFNNLLELFSDFTHLFKPTSNSNVSQEADKIVVKIKNIIREFESLNLEVIFHQYVPDSWNQLKEAMLKKIAKSMKGWFTKLEAETNKIEAELKAAYSNAQHELNFDQFQKLAHPVKDAILLAMETALTLYQEFILTLDKLEVQFGFREGALLQMLTHHYPESKMKIEVVETPEIKVELPATASNKETPEQKKEKRPSDYSKNILKKFEMLTPQYAALIKVRGFEPIELFPYFYSKQITRKKLHLKITADLQKKLTAYKSLTKNIRVAITNNLLPKGLLNILDFAKLKWSEEKSTLPEVITADEISAWSVELAAQLNQLKELYKSRKAHVKKNDKTALQTYKDNKKIVLAHHLMVIVLLRDLEFYLFEHQRIERILNSSQDNNTINPPRQINIADTLNLYKTQCAKIISDAKPYFDHRSKKREQLYSIKKEIEEKRKQIEEYFDPIFITHAHQKFIAENNAADKLIIPSQEIKQSISVAQKPEIITLKNPFMVFAYELLIIIFRALDSIDIVLNLASQKNIKSKATSPSEALSEDLTLANTIVEHAGKAFTAFITFSSYLKNAVLEEEPEKPTPLLENADEKTNTVSTGTVSLVQPFEEKKYDPAVPSKPKPTFLEQFFKKSSKKLNDEISKLKCLLISYNVEEFGFPEDVKNLILNIINDFKEIGPAFINSYKNYLAPPTMTTHLGVAAKNSRSLYKLLKKIDRLADIVSGVRYIIPIKILHLIKQIVEQVFVWLDQIEIYFYLKHGIILQKLKGISTHKNIIDIENFIKLIQDKIASFHFEPLQEVRNPNTTKILAKREAICTSENTLDEVKTIIAVRPVPAPPPTVIQFPLARQQLTELKCQIQSASSALNPSILEKNRTTIAVIYELLEKEADHKHSDSYLDDLDEMALTSKDSLTLFNSKLNDDLLPEMNKIRVLSQLDSDINHLKEKRNGWFLSQRSLEKRIIQLEALRRILRKQGYTLKNAADELTAPKWKALLKTDQALINKLDYIEKQLPEHLRTNKQILSLKLESKHPMTESHPIFKKIEQRIAALKLLFQSSINIRKQVLLTSLLHAIRENKKSFKNALQMVKENHPEDAYLLYHGATGKLILACERATARSRIIKSTIESQRLKYFASKTSLLEIKEAATDIVLLKKIRKDPEVKLLPAEEQRLTQIAPGLSPIRRRIS